MSLPDVKTHDAWTQGVKCSHPEADAADSEKSYLKIKKRFESVRRRSGCTIAPLRVMASRCARSIREVL